MNTTTGAFGDSGPLCKTSSTFHNPKGHHARAGSSIPGYAGFIPGKVAGNIFAKRFAMDNIHATQDLRRGGDEVTQNWMLASESDKRRTAHGAGVVGQHWKGTLKKAPTGDSAAVSWERHEPKATHEWLRY